MCQTLITFCLYNFQDINVNAMDSARIAYLIMMKVKNLYQLSDTKVYHEAVCNNILTHRIFLHHQQVTMQFIS